jgi:hypothetical protein
MDHTPRGEGNSAAARRGRIEALALDVVRRVMAGHDPCGAVRGLPGLCASGGGGGGALAIGCAGARQLASTLRVVATSYELLAKEKTATSREVYYMHAQYFSNQGEANAAVSKAADALVLKRHELGILSASRGFYAGLAYDEDTAATAAGLRSGGGRRVGAASDGRAVSSSRSRSRVAATGTPSVGDTECMAEIASGGALVTSYGSRRLGAGGRGARTMAPSLSPRALGAAKPIPTGVYPHSGVQCAVLYSLRSAYRACAPLRPVSSPLPSSPRRRRVA